MDRTSPRQGRYLDQKTNGYPNSITTPQEICTQAVPQNYRRSYHVQVLSGTKQYLATIMETIGWWLKSIKQGMWRTDLQMAEDLLCTGWLLFSANEYDCKALSQEIWNLAGVHVALRYCAIDDGRKKEGKTKDIPVKCSKSTEYIRWLPKVELSICIPLKPLSFHSDLK